MWEKSELLEVTVLLKKLGKTKQWAYIDVPLSSLSPLKQRKQWLCYKIGIVISIYIYYLITFHNYFYDYIWQQNFYVIKEYNR